MKNENQLYTGRVPVNMSEDNVPAVHREYENMDDHDTILRICPDRKLGVIGNKFSNMNLWGLLLLER